MYGLYHHNLTAEQMSQVISEVQAHPQWGPVPAKTKEAALEELYGDYVEKIVEELSSKLAPKRSQKVRKSRAKKKKEDTPSPSTE